MHRYYLTAYVTWSVQRGDTSIPVLDTACRELTIGIDAPNADEAIELAYLYLVAHFDPEIEVSFMPDEIYIGPASDSLADWAVERWQSSRSGQALN